MTVLPETRTPFPVQHPYFVRSDMYKLGSNPYGYTEDALFIVDAHYDSTIRACLHELKTNPQHARAYIQDNLEGLEACLWQIAALIGRELPEYATYEAGQFTSKLLGISLSQDGALQHHATSAIFPELGTACYEHLQSQTSLDRLCDLLRLSVQEDLVIGRVTPERDADVMEAMLVPIPSKWDPMDKIGLSFANVHAPIPHSERLVSASPNLVKAIMTRGDFVRYNWTLGTERWQRNPYLETDDTHEDDLVERIIDSESMLTNVYFRSERQTLTAFPDLNRYLFVIHTYLHPLREIVDTRDKQQHLLNVLHSMGDEVREERGLASTVTYYLEQALA